MASTTTVYWQDLCILKPHKRGFHLITEIINQHLHKAPKVEIGLLQLFLQHTSASLAISENSSQAVPADLEVWFNDLIPDSDERYQHADEGPDDMPAHIKNVVLGASLIIPIQNQQLALGQWQGIFLCEHRNHAPQRRILMTLQGSV